MCPLGDLSFQIIQISAKVLDSVKYKYIFDFFLKIETESKKYPVDANMHALKQRKYL